MLNKRILFLAVLALGCTSLLSAKSYLLRYNWQEGNIYHYKLTIKSPQFGSQEFFYDQIVEKLYTPGEVSFTFKTPLGTFKAKNSDIRPDDGAAIVRIVYTKGTENSKSIPKSKLLKNLLLYIKPNGETYVIHRKKIKGVWVFDFASVLDPEEKEILRKIIKSPTSVEYTICDNTVLTEYDPDGIFHPLYLPDNSVGIGEKWHFLMPGIKSDIAFEKMEKMGEYNCAMLISNTNFSAKGMMKEMPGVPEEEKEAMEKEMGVGMPEIVSSMMPDMKEHTTFYFDPDKGLLVRLIDHTEMKGPINGSFDSRLELVSAKLSSGETTKEEEGKTEEIGEKEVSIEEREEFNDYLLLRRKAARTVLKVLEPEGAMVEVRQEGNLLPLHRAEIPTMKILYSEGFYKIIVTDGEAKWENKIEIKKGMENILYVKSLIPEVESDEVSEEDAGEDELYPMSLSSFRSLIKSLKDEDFEATKLEILEDAASRNYFTVDHLVDILEDFTFEDKKIKACKIVYPKLVDREDFHKVYSSFEFSSSKKELKEWIKGMEENDR